jgi:hypothetical protein
MIDFVGAARQKSVDGQLGIFDEERAREGPRKVALSTMGCFWITLWVFNLLEMVVISSWSS